MRLKVRKATIPAAERDICERFGETVIAQTLASGHTPRAKELHAIYLSDLTVEHARDWLRESRDVGERRATVELLLEGAIIILIGIEIGLSVWGLIEARRLATTESEQMQEVTRSLESAREALNSSVSLAAKQLSLMQGMVDPGLEISWGDLFKPESTNEITIRNAGPQSAQDLSVDLRCLVFRNFYDKNPILLFQGLPTGKARSHWWYTPELRSGQTIQKNTSEALDNFLSNAEMMRKQQPAVAPSVDELNRPLPLASSELFVADFTYHRAVDNKKYVESRTAWLVRSSKTGKAVLETGMPVSAELQVFLSRTP